MDKRFDEYLATLPTKSSSKADETERFEKYDRLILFAFKSFIDRERILDMPYSLFILEVIAKRENMESERKETAEILKMFTRRKRK